MTTLIAALRNTITRRYVKVDETLAVTMITMDAVALAGYALVGLEIYGHATGPIAAGLTILTGHGGAWLRKRTDVPMLTAPAKTEAAATVALPTDGAPHDALFALADSEKDPVRAAGLREIAKRLAAAP